MRRYVWIFAFTILCIIPDVAEAASPASYVAYSLREAAAMANAGRSGDGLNDLGGITRIAGVVYDREMRDIILVGLAAPQLPVARFDDLVVALRARCRYDEWPLVSIDAVKDTERTKLQLVRFDGHLEDTPFGKDFLGCDIILKKYSLQKIDAVPSVIAYNRLLEDDIRSNVERSGSKVEHISWYSPEEGAALAKGHHGTPLSGTSAYQARFWFYAVQPWIAARKEDVFCIKELLLAVESQTLYEDGTSPVSRARVRFAEGWTEHFDEICQAYPTLYKLKVLYDLVAVAEVIRTMEHQLPLEYLLEGYPVSCEPTERNYRLEELYGLVERSDELRHLVRVSGGIEFRTEIKMLNYGDVTPLRKIVIESRPSPHTLVWQLPIELWRMPNAKDLALWEESTARSLSGRPDGQSGCSVLIQSVTLDPNNVTDNSALKYFAGFPPPPPPPPPMGGVSMQMKISNESFESTDDLDALREDILKSMPADSMSWRAPKKGN